MAQMNVSIPDALRSWAESRVAQGRYASTSDYIRDLIRKDQDVEQEFGWIERAVNEGLESPPAKRSLAEIMAAHRTSLG